MNRKSINNWAMLLVGAVLMITAATACKQNKSAGQTDEQAEDTQETIEALAEVMDKYNMAYSFQEGLAAVCNK